MNLEHPLTGRKPRASHSGWLRTPPSLAPCRAPTPALRPRALPAPLPPLSQVYNVAGERFVTFDGIAKACAAAMGLPEPEIVHFNPKDFDFGGCRAAWVTL